MMPRIPRPRPGEVKYTVLALLLLSPLLWRMGSHLIAYVVYVVAPGM